MHRALRRAVVAALLLPAVGHGKPTPGDAAALLTVADSLVEAGDLAGAEAAYAAASASGWSSAALQHNRGLAALRAGRPGDAIAHLLRARRLSPDEPAIQQSLAAARAAAGIAVTRRGSSVAAASANGVLALVVIAVALALLAVAMRRRRPLALALVAFALATWGVAWVTWVAAGPTATVAAPTDVRAAPATAAHSIVTLKPGRSVRTGASRGAWLAVRVPGGPAGWVLASAVVG